MDQYVLKEKILYKISHTGIMPRNSWVHSGSVHYQKEPLFRANHKIPQRPENNASVLLSFPLGCHSGCGDSLPEWSEVPLSWSSPFLCVSLPLGLQLHPAVFIGSSLSSQETFIFTVDSLPARTITITLVLEIRRPSYYQERMGRHKEDERRGSPYLATF